MHICLVSAKRRILSFEWLLVGFALFALARSLSTLSLSLCVSVLCVIWGFCHGKYAPSVVIVSIPWNANTNFFCCFSTFAFERIKLWIYAIQIRRNAEVITFYFVFLALNNTLLEIWAKRFLGPQRRMCVSSDSLDVFNESIHLWCSTIPSLSFSS